MIVIQGTVLDAGREQEEALASTVMVPGVLPSIVTVLAAGMLTLRGESRKEQVCAQAGTAPAEISKRK